MPNIGSNLGSQSVFTQLFPSVPDISQTPLATVAHGGPILASDSLPGYRVGGGVNFGDTDVSDPNHGVNPRSPFRRFQGTNVGTDPYYADEGELEIFLNQGFTLQDIFGPGYTDRLNRYTGRTITPSGIIRRDPNIDSLDPDQAELQLMADGGPILASDFLPGYQDAGDVNAELEARRPEIMTGLREFFVERGRYTDEQFLAEFGKMPTEDLLREFMAQKKADERFSDRFPSLRGVPSPEPSPDAPPETPSLRAPYEIPKNYYPPEYEFLEEGPTELDYDMRLPEQFQNPSHTVPSFPPGPLGVRQAANGGPILASEYLNAGGPARYFENGGAVGAGFRPGDDTSDTPGNVPGQVDAGLDDPAAFQQVTPESPRKALTPLTEVQVARLTARQFDQLPPELQLEVARNKADFLQPEVPANSTAFKAAQNAINPQFTDLSAVINQSLRAPGPRGVQARGEVEQDFPAAAALLPPRPTGLFGGLFGNAEGGPIMASERLNAGGPVQYFQNAGSVEGWGNVDETDFSLDPSSPNVASAPSVAVGTSPSVGFGNPDPTDFSLPSNNTNTNIAQGLDFTDFATSNIGLPGTDMSLPFSPLDAYLSLFTSMNPAIPVAVGVARGFQALEDYNNNVPVSGLIGNIVAGGLNALGIEPGDITPDEDQSIGSGDDPTDFSSDPNDLSLLPDTQQ